MFEVAMIFRDPKRAVPVQRVGSGVGRDLDLADDIVQARVISGTACTSPLVKTHHR
jgi:hypothetical protein